MGLDSEMHGQSRLQKRGSVYYFRAMIPKDLYVHYGRKEIVYSLKTKDFREAKRLVRQESVRIDEEFESIRRQRTPEGPHTLAVLDDAVIRNLCDTWRHECLSTDVWSRAQGLSDAEFDDAKAQRAETLAALRDILAKGRLEKITPALTQFLHFINVDFFGPPEGLRKLAWTFLETAIETHQAIMRRDQGEVVSVPEPPRPVTRQSAKCAIKGSGSEPTFADCFEIWEAAVIDRPVKTVADFKSVLNDFVGWSGNRPASQFSREEAYTYADYIRQRDDLDPETVDKKVGHLRAIYNAAKLRLKLPENPFSRLFLAKERTKKPKRLPLNQSDLDRVFSAPIYQVNKRPKGGAGEAAVWLPLLSLFTGARLEELGQLLVADIGCEQGVHFIHITDLEDEDDVEEDGGVSAQPKKRLKNGQSRRKVPIHPELIRSGFLLYVEKMRKRGKASLFPKLKVDCHGKITGNYSKWWGNYRRKVIGVRSRLKPFHSFRHTFRDACREAELGEEVSDALMGHAARDKTGRSYGSGFSLSVLHRSISKIQYQDLEIPVLITNDSGMGAID